MASVIASCVSGLPDLTSKSNVAEKENLLALVKWLSVTSSVMDRLTDKCKISKMMIILEVLCEIYIQKCTCCGATRLQYC